MSTLMRMYDIQKRLNERAGFPYDDPSNLQRTMAALNSESHEALRELKGLWCWWKELPIDERALTEEVVDCWFFTLTLLELGERAGLYDPDPAFQHFTFHELQGLRKTLDPYRDASRNAYLQALLERLSILSSHSGNPQVPFATVLMLFSVLMAATDLLGLNLQDLYDAYLQKALVNLERWGAEGEELYQEIDTILRERGVKAA